MITNNNVWECTDIDMTQYCKKINDTTFMYVEIRCVDNKYIVCSDTIDITDYTDAELWEYCSGYYSSYQEIINTYGVEFNKIIAECVFEQLNFDEMNNCFVYNSEDDAINFIQNYMIENI